MQYRWFLPRRREAWPSRSHRGMLGRALLTMSLVASMNVMAVANTAPKDSAPHSRLGTSSAPTLLWHSLLITLPKGIVAIHDDDLLEPRYYKFTVLKTRLVPLTARLGTYVDPGGGNFFSRRDLAKSAPIILNGMHAWRKTASLYSLIDLKLPKPKGCAVQYYVLLIFMRADLQAQRLVQSLQSKRPYPCLSSIPLGMLNKTEIWE